jgi:hypothetical protein
MSFAFIGLIICTYFSWSNYYFAQKCDPGYILPNHDQQNRVNRFIINQIKNSLFLKDNYSIN